MKVKMLKHYQNKQTQIYTEKNTYNIFNHYTIPNNTENATFRI